MIPGISTKGPSKLKAKLENLQVPRIRIPKHDHIPHVPIHFQYLNVLQLVLSTIILGLTAAAVDSIHYSRSIPAFALFVSIASIIVISYRWLALFRLPALYNRLAILILECLLLVWWLSAFASLAAWSAGLAWLDSPVCSVDRNGNRYCIYRRAQIWNGRKYRDLIAAAASIGALQFVLSIITLTIYAIHFHRLRIMGAPYTMHGKWSASPSPELTPTGITMTHRAIQNPVMTPSQFETTRAPPKITTIPTSHLPIAEEFSTPLEQVSERGPRGSISGVGDGFVEQRTFAPEGIEGKVEEGEVKVKRPEIRHSGTFYIDDGVVAPTDITGVPIARADGTIA